MWKEIESFDRPDGEKVDVWMGWGASAMTFGMGDSFKLEGGAWRKASRWYHEHKGAETELQRDYVRFWAPFGEGTESPDPWEEAKDRRDYARLKTKFSEGVGSDKATDEGAT